MFKLEVLVEDKNVVSIMRALDGKVVGEPKWREARGAVVVEGEAKEAILPGATLPQKVAAYLMKHTAGPDVTRQALVEAIGQSGGKVGSVFYVADQLRHLKVLGAPSRHDNRVSYPIKRSNGNGVHLGA